jgi:hypothetical protein
VADGRVGVRGSGSRLIARMAVLLVLLGTLLPAATHAEDRQQSGNPMIFGIASHAWWLDPEAYGDQLFPAMEDLGVTTVRVSIDWRRFEPEQGTFDWGMYDRVFGGLAERNIVIIANFNTIPGWASVDKPGCDSAFTEIYLCQLREDMYPAYERAVRAAVTRYAWIRHWEFWNEPEMWRYLGEDATVYLRNLRIFYDVAKQVNPEFVIAACTLIGRDYFEYVYNLSDAWYGRGNEPWDAVSIHPYNWNFEAGPGVEPLELNYDRIEALHALLTERGAGHMKLWITEYGWNNAVEHQARNLVATFDWLKRQPYIEFAHLHMLHDWNEEALDAFGLMAIVPDAYGVPRLTPEAVFVPKWPFYNAFKHYPRDGFPLQPAGPNLVAFPVTGHVVEGRFLRAWEARGGLRITGYPLTRPYPRQQTDGSWLLVQDFERARLEFHPEHLGEWGEVLGTLIGSEVTAQRRDEAAFRPLPCPEPGTGATLDPNRECFAETGHWLAYGFRSFWHANGGLAAFGYPISEEFDELNPDTGRIHTVQYFERARFEYHPEHAGTEYEVLLGLLIRDDLQESGWLWPAVGSRLPTVRAFE